jgi:hypothetical protein
MTWALEEKLPLPKDGFHYCADWIQLFFLGDFGEGRKKPRIISGNSNHSDPPSEKKKVVKKRGAFFSVADLCLDL